MTFCQTKTASKFELNPNSLNLNLPVACLSISLTTSFLYNYLLARRRPETCSGQLVVPVNLRTGSFLGDAHACCMHVLLNLRQSRAHSCEYLRAWRFLSVSGFLPVDLLLRLTVIQESGTRVFLTCSGVWTAISYTFGHLETAASISLIVPFYVL